MTAPERLMTYRGPIDRLRYRLPARNASLRSRTSSNTRTIASKRHAFHLDVRCSQLHPLRLTLALPSLRSSAPIEIP